MKVSEWEKIQGIPDQLSSTGQCLKINLSFHDKVVFNCNNLFLNSRVVIIFDSAFPMFLEWATKYQGSFIIERKFFQR
jgi:hypothetical protein